MTTLTAANAKLVLTIPGLYGNGVGLAGFPVDDIFMTDSVKPIEALMGVDGRLSYGWTPYPVDVHIHLQADSASNLVFDNWLQAQAAVREAYPCSFNATVPGIDMQYNFTNGVLTTASVMPSSKKILQPREFVITFESCQAMPIL